MPERTVEPLVDTNLLLSDPPPSSPEITCGFLKQLVFCKKKMWFIGVEAEQETFLSGAPPLRRNPGSAPQAIWKFEIFFCFELS